MAFKICSLKIINVKKVKNTFTFHKSTIIEASDDVTKADERRYRKIWLQSVDSGLRGHFLEIKKTFTLTLKTG